MPRPGKLPDEPKTESPSSGLVYAFLNDGIRYELHGHWGWSAANLVRRATGMGVPKIINELRSGNGDPELLGFLVFLAKTEDGVKSITIDEAQSLVGYDKDFVTPDGWSVDYVDNEDYVPVEGDPGFDPDEEPAPEAQGSS